MSSTVKVEIISDGLLACRICLASDVKLYNIQRWGLDQIFVDLMGTTLSVWDGFPQHLCSFCRALLLKSHQLRTRCRRAEELLKQSLMHQHFITTSFIQSIDREAHRLTHPFSQNCRNSDLKTFNHDDLQTDTQTAPIENYVFLVDNDTDDDVKFFDIHTADDVDFKMGADLNGVDAELQLDVTKDESLEVIRVETNEIKGEVQNLKRKKLSNEEEKCKRKKVGKTMNKDVVKSSQRKKVVSNKNNKGAVNSKRKNVVSQETEIEKVERLNTKKVVNSEGEKKGDLETSKSETEVRNEPKKREPKSKKRGQRWRLKVFCKEEDIKEFEVKYNFKVVTLTEEEMVKEMEARRESDNYKFGVFKCEMCFKGFLSSSTYENHLKTHDPTRKYACRLCHLRYHFPAMLRNHMHRAHELKFLCLQCNEVIRSRACAMLHAEFHAGKTFKCDHCDMKFLKKTSRSTHMRMEHPREIADGGTCELCGETFTSALGLKSHKTRSHKTHPTLPRLVCRTCKLRFETTEAIEKHRNDQPKGKCDGTRSACLRCGATYSNEQELLAHRIAEHQLQLFTCDTCGKSFESKESVATHMDRVHYHIRPRAPARPGFRQRPRVRSKPPDAYRPVCEHCGKRATCMATLKLHMNQHTGERPYKCTLCPKTYRTPVGLNSHQAFHTGARKYRCQECPAAFMHQSSLYQHRKAIHSGEKAYQCTICEKTFTQSGSLHTHVKYVHMKVKPPPRKRNKKTA